MMYATNIATNKCSSHIISLKDHVQSVVKVMPEIILDNAAKVPQLLTGEACRPR